MRARGVFAARNAPPLHITAPGQAAERQRPRPENRTGALC
jgi:hypothetical protein